MKRGILFLSIGVNLLLAAVVLHRGRAPSASVESSLVPLQSTQITAHEISLPGPAEAETAIPVTNRFYWGKLESENYEQYIANLRSIGCPEKTIRDIIIADVEKLYTVKIASVPFGSSFWSTGAKRAAAARARDDRQQALETEKNTMLDRLLGPGSHPDREEHSDDLIEQAIMRFVIGPMSDESLQRVFAVMKKGESLEKEIQRRASGIMLPEDEEAVATGRAQVFADLKRLLTPAQLEEFAARAAAVNLSDHGLDYFHTTPAELRQIAVIYASIFGLTSGKVSDLFDHRQKTDAQEHEFETRLRVYLGETRFAEFQRANDSDYRALLNFSEQNNLPTDTASKIYSIKQAADAAREDLQADTSLTAAGKTAQLREIQNSTAQAVQQLLGNNTFTEYLRQGNGQWVTNYVGSL